MRNRGQIASQDCQLTRADRRDRNRQHDAQQQDLELRQGDTGDDTEREQQAVVAQPHPPHQQPNHQEPVDRVRGCMASASARTASSTHRCLRGGGESLCAPVTSEFAGDETGNDDPAGGCQHSGYAQGDQRTGCDRIRQRGQHWCERRLVGRSPVKLTAADRQHVHLVEPQTDPHRMCLQRNGHPLRRSRWGATTLRATNRGTLLTGCRICLRSGTHVRPRYCRSMTLGIDEQVLAEMAPLFAAVGESEPHPSAMSRRGASTATECSISSPPGGRRPRRGRRQPFHDRGGRRDRGSRLVSPVRRVRAAPRSTCTAAA